MGSSVGFIRTLGWTDTDKHGRTRTEWRESMVFRKTLNTPSYARVHPLILLLRMF